MFCHRNINQSFSLPSFEAVPSRKKLGLKENLSVQIGRYGARFGLKEIHGGGELFLYLGDYRRDGVVGEIGQTPSLRVHGRNMGIARSAVLQGIGHHVSDVYQ